MMTFFQNPLTQLLAAQPSNKIAVWDGKKTITCGEIYVQAQQLSIALKRMGFEEKDTAILAVAPGIDLLVIIYGCMLAGIPAALIDPEMGRENYHQKLAQLKPSLAFVDYRLLLLREHPIVRAIYFRLNKKGPYFPFVKECRIIATGNWLPIFSPHIGLNQLLKKDLTPREIHFIKQSPNHPVIIVYTSGTLASPKGVVHSSASISSSIKLLIDLLKNGSNTAMATHLPHFALIGVSAGIPVHIWPYPMLPAEQIAFIEQHKISTLFGPPSDFLPLIEHCKTEKKQLPACLRSLFFGSAPVRRAFLEQLVPILPEHCQITCLYGMTEHLLIATCDGRKKAVLDCEGDYLGTLIPQMVLEIEADHEISLQSPQLFQRYLDQSAQAGFFKTGDMGYLDAEGQLILTGRKKDMIIRRNFNLYPGLYEPTISRIPGVVDCAMVGRWSDAQQDEEVVLVVEANQPIAEQKLMEMLRHGKYSIDAEAMPDEVVFMPLPRSGRQHKVDKKALRELVSHKAEAVQNPHSVEKLAP